jgi:hypothetical protein
VLRIFRRVGFRSILVGAALGLGLAVTACHAQRNGVQPSGQGDVAVERVQLLVHDDKDVLGGVVHELDPHAKPRQVAMHVLEVGLIDLMDAENCAIWGGRQGTRPRVSGRGTAIRRRSVKVGRCAAQSRAVSETL